MTRKGLTAGRSWASARQLRFDRQGRPHGNEPGTTGGSSTGGGNTGGGNTGGGGTTGGSAGTTGNGSSTAPAGTTRPFILFGRITSSGPKVIVAITCRGAVGAVCRLQLKLTATAVYKGAKLIGFEPQQVGLGRTHHKIVTMRTLAINLQTGGPARALTPVLDGLGRRALAQQGGLNVSLIATQGSGKQTTTLLIRKLQVSAN